VISLRKIVLLKSTTRFYSFDDFSQGLDWSAPADRVEGAVLHDAKNVNLTLWKAIEKRNGCSKLFATSYDEHNRVESMFEHYRTSGASLLLVQCGGNLGYYSSSWNTLITGLTLDKPMSYARHLGYTFCVNGSSVNHKIINTSVYNVGITPPVSAPGVTRGSSILGTTTADGPMGTYRYKYTYYKSGAPVCESNGSPASSSVLNIYAGNNYNILVPHVASTDPQVDQIRIYRSVDETVEAYDTWYLVAAIANTTGTYSDILPDASLGAVLETTHTKPPIATYITLHKNRMIYANCPTITDGNSVFMYSEVGQPEYCPSGNYQYFDRSDGDEITGAASLGDYLIIFKKKKVAIMEGSFSEWYTLSPNVGCVAPWAIIKFIDRVMFLSEEGWKITDGKEIFDVSKKLSTIIQGGYISWDNNLWYSAAYYPVRKQFLYLLGANNMVMVGHSMSLLYQDSQEDNTVDAQYIGWTYHVYPNQSLSCLGTYTDSMGITRIVAGDYSGHIYQLDDGTTDDGYDIPYQIETGWSTFTASEYKSIRDYSMYSKDLRMLNFVYSNGNAETHTVEVDIDYAKSIDSIYLTKGLGSFCGPTTYCGYTYCGSDSTYTENLPVSDKCTGRKFRFRVYGSTDKPFTLREINCAFRLSNIREGV